MDLSATLAPGTTLGGHYIVGTLINSGGFGAVYRGVDTSEGNRPCAIKETYDVTPASRRQALMEASVLFTVRSKHLPQVYDAFEANGRFYLIMQLIEGQDLLLLLKNRVPNGRVGEQEPHRQSYGPCSVPEVLGWLLPVMEVLQELHSRHPAVIHRDIKPANIILASSQVAVLVDFGLTKLYDPLSHSETMTRAVSEGFSPVEQYIGKMSPQSDIYSMAATIYLLLTNRLPPIAIKRTVKDELIAPSALNPTISPQVEQALLKALAVNAEQRFQSMSEFARALQEPELRLHNDPTLENMPVGALGGQTQSVPPRSYAAVPTTPTLPVAAPPEPALSPRRGFRNPLAPKTPQAAQSPATPAADQTPQPPASVPSGYVIVPRAMLTTGPLPSSYKQGCLWGIIQGVLSALLLLLLKKEAYFYLAIITGFVFYIIAGLATTWRGGPSLRGAWAGAWAGVFSTISFWIVLLLGTVILVALNIGAEISFELRNGQSLQTDLAHAWQAVYPTIPNNPLGVSQTPLVNIAILLLIGLLLACVLGWVGGLLGGSLHKARIKVKLIH